MPWGELTTRTCATDIGVLRKDHKETNVGTLETTSFIPTAVIHSLISALGGMITRRFVTGIVAHRKVHRETVL